jgi:hypothetical protein
MKTKNLLLRTVKLLAFGLLTSIFPLSSMAQSYDTQRLEFGLHFDPVISWFGSDIKEVRNQGARPGYNLGITFNKFFGENYAFSAGVSLINAGGKLKSTVPTIMEYSNFTSLVEPGKPVIYKINYLSFPVGLKLQTNEIGYITYFTNVGMDPKFVLGGKNTIPSLSITDENADKELKFFNLGYHITAGIEYSLGGSTAVVLGINYENNFIDITKDNGVQPEDRITHRLLSFRLGLNF